MLTHNSLEFAKNTLSPFDDHSCSDSLVDFEIAVGSGRFSDRTFHIRRCSTCGLGFTDPVPTKETAYLLYETRESNDFQPDDSPLTARLKSFAAQRGVRHLLHQLDMPAGPVLDYGCGNAAFTVALQKAFPNLLVIGADMQQQTPTGLAQSSYCSYAEIEKLAGRCSLVLCRHVLEHSYDPVGMLKKLRGLLMPRGVLIVEVPSLEAKARLLFGKSWDGYYVPFHPIHFTRGSLRRAFQQANFNIIREGKAEMPKMGRSLQNLLGLEYNAALFSIGMLLQPLQIGIGIATNTSVCLRIWGRKAGE